MGGRSKAQTIGFRYYMSMHMGLCRGPVDEIVQIKVGDLRAWPYSEAFNPTANLKKFLEYLIALKGGSALPHQLVTGAEGPDGKCVILMANGESYVREPSETFTTQDQWGQPVEVVVQNLVTWRHEVDSRIDAGDLFGGDKKEGGIAGTVRVMMGGASQIVPDWIKTRMGGRVPAFRGVATLFFDGLLTSINPYPKKWEFRVRRTTKGWDGEVWEPSLVTIWMADGTIKAMNPAHILFETLTNRDWGRGMSRDRLLNDSWVKGAQTLFDENFGLCLRYNRQSELSSFIQEVLEHVGGAIYPDRSTGKLALSLIRSDYDPNDLPLFTYDSGLIELDDSDTSAQDDIVNEVIVKWFNPLEKEERSVRVQNLASLQSSGATNSSTASYSGLPTVDLALRVAQRDLKANATSLKRYKVTLDRSAWKIVPGSVFRISVPQKGIYNAVLRAGKVSEGSHIDGRITVEAVLDVFGLPSSSFISPEQSEWVAPDRGVYVPERRIVREATYVDIFKAMDPANRNILSPEAGTIGAVVGRPSALTQAYETLSKAGGETDETLGGGTFVPYVLISSAVDHYATSIPFNSAVDIGLIAMNSMVQIGGEIMRLVDIDVSADGVSGHITVARGCVDTVPLAHATGSAAYFIAQDVNLGGDGREYASGEVVEIKVLPYSSSTTLSSDLAEVDVLPIDGRQGRPYPPADVRINGTPYASAASVVGQVVLTWVHRDRLLQQDQLFSHVEPTIGPEAGTTYTVRVYDGDSPTPVRTVNNISGTTFTYTGAMSNADGVGLEVWFELESRRGGISSFNKYRFGINNIQSGYGRGYGNSYGN